VRRAPGRLRSTRGAPADLARGSGGARTWWSAVAAAAQSGCAAEQLGGGALGLGVAALGGWVQGVSVGLKGAPGISGGRAPEGKAGEKSGLIPLRGCCASGGRGEDGPDPWVRPGSEGRRRARGGERAGLERVGPRELAGPSGMRGELGPRKRKKEQAELGRGERVGRTGWSCWVGFGFPIGFLFSFSISYSSPF